MESRILDVSPDDRILAVAINSTSKRAMCGGTLEGGSKSRLTLVRTGALSGAFSPDGKRFAMTSGFYGQSIAVEIRSLVSNLTEKIYDSPFGACIVTGWSRDGKYLVVDTQSPKTGFDVQSFDLARRTMTPVVQGPGDEVAPALSPKREMAACTC